MRLGWIFALQNFRLGRGFWGRTRVVTFSVLNYPRPLNSHWTSCTSCTICSLHITTAFNCDNSPGWLSQLAANSLSLSEWSKSCSSLEKLPWTFERTNWKASILSENKLPGNSLTNWSRISRFWQPYFWLVHIPFALLSFSLHAHRGSLSSILRDPKLQSEYDHVAA